MSDHTLVWFAIFGLGLITFSVRFSFLGLLGNRKLPLIVERFLSFVPVTVLPAVVAPIALWPTATHEVTDPARLIAALVTFASAWALKSMMKGFLIGLGCLLALLNLPPLFF